jgi:GAF domain-containing protein
MFDVAHVDFRRLEGNLLRIVSSAGPTMVQVREALPDLPLEPTDPVVRSFLDNRQIAVEDRRATLANEHGEIARALLNLPLRSQAYTPLAREGKAIGVMIVNRSEVRPFQEHELELMKGFADQAVIAIENARLLNELRQRTADLSESLEQQTATSEVLGVIGRSPGELEPVFQAMLENAVRICEAKFGHIYRWNGDVLSLAATYNTPPAYEALRRAPHRPGSRSPTARVVTTKTIVHVIDMKAEESYKERDPRIVEAVELAGMRTYLGVPMLKENELIGVLALYRNEVRPFTDKQIELLQNFAAQAVIAIENARLLNELRQRTNDLTESLEQQTATADVLRIISSSPGELKPVFQAMLDSATRICEAKFGTLFLCEDDAFRVVATNLPPALAELRRRDPVVRPGPGSSLVRCAETRQVVQIADMKADKGYAELREPLRVALVEIGGIRSVLSVPVLKENALIGVFNVYSEKVGSYSDKHVDLVENFAAQAVIAIENARLLNELRESLQQQTATSQVLSVISSSPANIQPLLEIIGERAEKLCDAEISLVSIVDGDLIRLASIHGVAEGGVEALQRAFPMRLTDETVTARAIRTRSVCHVADVLSDPQYQHKDTARLGGVRGGLGVPMVRDEQVVGAIFVARKQPGLFSDAQVQLLKTFADQAVIAIENVRLFNETKRSLEQQTATADVLKIISRSAFDLRTVLQTLVESAARFCAADKAHIIREKNGGFYTAEAFGIPRSSRITSRIFR